MASVPSEGVTIAQSEALPDLDHAPIPTCEKPRSLSEEVDMPPAGPRNSRWMRTGDVLDYLGVCSATLYRAINTQGFPRPRKLGNVSLWLRDEIDEFMMGLPVMEIPKLDWPDGKRARSRKAP